jgi:hypothetical protein
MHALSHALGVWLKFNLHLNAVTNTSLIEIPTPSVSTHVFPVSGVTATCSKLTRDYVEQIRNFVFNWTRSLIRVRMC